VALADRRGDQDVHAKGNEAFSIGADEEEICLASEGHNIMFFAGTETVKNVNARYGRNDGFNQLALLQFEEPLLRPCRTEFSRVVVNH